MVPLPQGGPGGRRGARAGRLRPPLRGRGDPAVALVGRAGQSGALALRRGTSPRPTPGVARGFIPRRPSVHRLGRLGGALAPPEVERLACALRDHDVVARLELAPQDLLRQRILDEALDGALERAGAVDGIVPGVRDGLSRRLGELDGELAVLEELPQPAELDLHDAADLVAPE